MPGPAPQPAPAPPGPRPREGARARPRGDSAARPPRAHGGAAAACDRRHLTDMAGAARRG